jgi:hypothetical protein
MTRLPIFAGSFSVDLAMLLKNKKSPNKVLTIKIKAARYPMCVNMNDYYFGAKIVDKIKICVVIIFLIL